jgi:hypothetical protein
MKRFQRLLPAIAVGLVGFTPHAPTHLDPPDLQPLPLSACQNPPGAAHLDVPLVGQETGLWCWAATAQMTMNYIRPQTAVTQCKLATDARMKLAPGAPYVDCCQDKASCTFPYVPDYGLRDFKADESDTVQPPKLYLTWPEIQDQIACKQKPFAYSWEYDDPAKGGHVVVVIGYKTIANVNYVEINDPIGGSYNCQTQGYSGEYRIETYESYKGGPAFGRDHLNDYYNITYNGNGP